MSEQWTWKNPGAGSTGSLDSLAKKLRDVESELDAGLTDLDRARRLFGNDWSGKAAEAAEAKAVAIGDDLTACLNAVQQVKNVIGPYVDEIVAIKAAAAPERAKRKAALARLQEEADPKEPLKYEDALREAGEANAELTKLGERRRRADDALLQAVRAAVATTWDVPPEDYPEDRDWFEDATYDYSMDHPLGFSSKEYTAKELMDLFKAHPEEVFPFDVAGSSDRFEDGAVFRLEDTLGPMVDLPFETGDVVVTTTDTSVKFTVISDTYFDGPGSTIEFSIVEVGGQYVLRKVAHATDANRIVAGGVGIGAGDTWSRQAENLKKVVHQYGN